MRPTVPEQLRAERERLAERIDEIDQDLSSLEGFVETAYAPVPAREFLREPGNFNWLMGGLIAQGSVTMMAAEPRMGKTTLLVQMALCMSAGREWLGRVVPRPIKTLYVLAEGSRNAFRERLRTACDSLRIDTDNLGWHIQPAAQSEFNLRSREIDRLFSASAQAGIELAILDTMGYFHGGDENDNSAWKKCVMTPLRAASARYGLSFVLVHHYGKSVPGKARWERGRGASAMFGDVDHWMGLEKIELTDDEEELSEPERLRLLQRRELFVEKNKYGRDDYSMRLNFLKEAGIFEPEDGLV